MVELCCSLSIHSLKSNIHVLVNKWTLWLIHGVLSILNITSRCFTILACVRGGACLRSAFSCELTNHVWHTSQSVSKPCWGDTARHRDRATSIADFQFFASSHSASFIHQPAFCSCFTNHLAAVFFFAYNDGKEGWPIQRARDCSERSSRQKHCRKHKWPSNPGWPQSILLSQVSCGKSISHNEIVVSIARLFLSWVFHFVALWLARQGNNLEMLQL